MLYNGFLTVLLDCFDHWNESQFEVSGGVALRTEVLRSQLSIYGICHVCIFGMQLSD